MIHTVQLHLRGSSGRLDLEGEVSRLSDAHVALNVHEQSDPGAGANIVFAVDDIPSIIAALLAVTADRETVQ